MRKLIYLSFLIISVMVMNSCSTNKMADQNLAIIDKYVQAVEDKDIETMASLLHDDYKGYGPSINDSTDRNQAIESWEFLADELYEEIKYENYQNIAVTIKDGPQKGDWVSNWAKLSLTFKDGRGPVELYFNAVYRIQDEKIIHSRTFYNEADVLEQLGYSFY